MSAIESLLRAHIRGARETIADAVTRVDALEELVGRLGTAMSVHPTQRKRRPDGWSEEENELLREHYPTLGAVGCKDLLPHRTPLAIRGHAHQLGVVCMDSFRKFWCEQCEHNLTAGRIAECQSKFCKGKALVAGVDG